MLTLLTATGARAHAWALCERWMAAQDYAGQVRWLVVDDGQEPQPITFQREKWTLNVIRPRRLWTPGRNSQAENLLHGLSHCSASDRVVVIEDDDYYSPDWLSHVAVELDRAQLVGEHRSRYYNVATRQCRQLENTAHASLCSTAVRGRGVDAMRKACQTNRKFIDINLWRRFPDRHLFEGHRVTGIKGLPGRGGIGAGHKQGFHGVHDHDGAVLRQWIGRDAEAYL